MISVMNKANDRVTTHNPLQQTTAHAVNLYIIRTYMQPSPVRPGNLPMPNAICTTRSKRSKRPQGHTFYAEYFPNDHKRFRNATVSLIYAMQSESKKAA
jgi:hypothetical protein